jgi:hypothetical protein
MVTHDGMHFDDDAVALALDLERAGHTLTAKDGVLTCTNKATLTPDQIAAIRKHRLMLLGIVGYESTRTL